MDQLISKKMKVLENFIPLIEKRGRKQTKILFSQAVAAAGGVDFSD